MIRTLHFQRVQVAEPVTGRLADVERVLLQPTLLAGIAGTDLEFPHSH